MLIRKMIRDIVRNKVQFAAIFLMMFFGCFLFSGITGEWMGLEQHFNEYMKTQNMADAWAVKENIKEGGFTQEEIQKLKQTPEIAGVESRLVLPMNPAGIEDASLECYFSGKNEISSLFIQRGEAFDPNKHGIWLDELFAGENNYSVGDQITLQYQNIKIEGTVLGLVNSPEYVYSISGELMVPDHKNSGFAWASPSLLPKEMENIYNQIALKAATDVTEKEQKEILKDTLGETGITVVCKKDHPSVSVVLDEIAQHQSMGNIFSAAFLFIAVMIVMTTMHRMLKSQRTQIGILKALGFRKWKLLRHYLSHIMVTCLGGALSGYLLGYRILPGLIYRFMSSLYVIPEWGGYLPIEYIFLPIGCAIISMAVSFLICRKYLKPNAAVILYGEGAVKKAKPLPKIFECLDFSGRWNARDIGRNKLRSVMTLLGVLGCTALLFCAFTMYDTFAGLSQWTFHKQQAYECKITELPDSKGQQELLEMTDGEYLLEGTALILKENKEETQQSIKVSGSKGTLSREEKEVSLTVIEDTKYVKLAETLNSFTEIQGGAAISKKTADSLKLKVGDWIEWKQKDEKEYIRSQIKAVIRTPLSQGITIMKADYEKTGQKYEPTGIIGKEPVNGFGNYAETSLISHQRDMTKGVDSLMEAMVMMIMILVIAAVLLGGVMLYNLGILSYLERLREFATMKVLGFEDRKIRKILIQQNVWLSGLGIVLGLPAGYGLFLFLLSTLPDTMDVPMYVSLVSMALCAAGTLGLSWVISKIVSGKISHINMVEALKAKE